MYTIIIIVHVHVFECSHAPRPLQAGQTVPIASLLLGDPTRAYFKLTLWREAACWVERLRAGDIVHFTSELQLWLVELLAALMHLCRMWERSRVNEVLSFSVRPMGLLAAFVLDVGVASGEWSTELQHAADGIGYGFSGGCENGIG